MCLLVNISKKVSDPGYLWRSKHPREQAILDLAEKIFETLTGDTPDYSDDDDDDDGNE